MGGYRHPRDARGQVGEHRRVRVRLAQGDGGSARALARRASLHLDGMVAAIADAEARTAFLALEFNREILAADNAGPPS